MDRDPWAVVPLLRTPPASPRPAVNRLHVRLVVLVALLVPQAAAGQSVDERLLLWVYEAEAPAVRTTLRAADASALTLFAAVPAAAWGYALVEPEARDEAWRLSLSAAGAFGAAMAAKRVVRRPRPFDAVPGVTSRSRGVSARLEREDVHSFPSGHAALAFALATAGALEAPRWYVAAPGMVWAATVSVSRVWMGVHYPSDVLAGALLGAGSAVVVHLLRDALTPDGLEPDGPEGAAVTVFAVRVPLP